MKRVSLRGVLLALLLVVVGASIAVAAYVTTKGGSSFELRKKAAPAAAGSRLYFKGPTQVKIGEQFSVDVYLDTTNDPQYTISGVDARISIANDASESALPEKPRGALENVRRLPLQVLAFRNVTPGKIFDSYPTVGNGKPPIIGDPPVCGGLSGKTCPGGLVCIDDSSDACDTARGGRDCMGICIPAQSEAGKGQSGGQSYGVVTSTLTTPSASPPASVCPPFPGCNVINNPQIRMQWHPCWESEANKCPAPTPTPTYDKGEDTGLVVVSGVKNYAVDEKGQFKGFTGIGVVATLTFRADRPGKATLRLVYSSPTATDDTNITGFLADQPAAIQKPQERLTMAPEVLTIEVVSATPTPPSAPLPPSCLPLPDCVDGIEDATGRKIDICQLVPPPPGQTYCPRPTATPEPTVLPTPTPTPTPEPRVLINIRLALEGRESHASIVDIYGVSTAYAKPSKEVLQLLGSGGSTVVVEGAFLPGSRIDKLGTTATNQFGIGTLSLDRTYIGAGYYLLAQTPSHLRKLAQNYQVIQLDAGQNPACRAEICTQEVKYVDFGTLPAGDIYVDEKGNKDNFINTFDVGSLYAAWSGAHTPREKPLQTFLPEMPEPADLNGDGVVNNRDLAMLFANFNKRGDSSVSRETPVPLPPPSPVSSQ